MVIEIMVAILSKIWLEQGISECSTPVRVIMMIIKLFTSFEIIFCTVTYAFQLLNYFLRPKFCLNFVIENQSVRKFCNNVTDT